MKKTGIAAALLLAVMLTGCGGNSSSTGDAVSSAETTTAAAETTTSAAETTTAAAETTASAAETTTAAADTTGAAADTTAAAADTTAAAGETAENTRAENGQNPMMNFIGKYRCDRALITVDCTGANGAKFTVTWGGSATEGGVWTMSGESEETDTAFVIKYTDCVHKNETYDAEGKVTKSETVYENGTGTMTFDKTTNKLTWKDDKEDAAKDMEFTYSAE